MHLKNLLAIGQFVAIGYGAQSKPDASKDALKFFQLHDLDHSSSWDRSEIARIYGANKKSSIVDDVLRVTDINRDGRVTLDEWRVFVGKGKKLPTVPKSKQEFSRLKSFAQKFAPPSSQLEKQNSVQPTNIPNKYRST